ncbi:MAG: RNA methyltransferase [Elusimicrobiota bacterium]
MKKIIISSTKNPDIKHIRKLLDDRQYRYERGEYVVEGINTLDNLGIPKKLYVREGCEIPSVNCETVFILPEIVFNAVSSTENSRGVIAIVPLKLLTAKDIDKNGRYVFLDRIQDPGNLGAIMRSACAFGYKGIIVTPGTVDPFSPKSVRAAASAFNTMDIVKIENAAQLEGLYVIAADMKGKDISGYAWPQAFILAFGNEGAGISEELRKSAKDTVSIPMLGNIESLNAAASAAIIMYSSTHKDSI